MTTVHVSHSMRASYDFLCEISATDRAKPYGDRAEIMEIVHPPHGNRTMPVRLPNGGRAVMVRCLFDRHVVLGIRVPKVYKFTFLLVLHLEQKAEKERGLSQRKSGKC